MANNINITFSKADMGLENVDNTSDLNKPISTATQTALDDKVDKEAGSRLITSAEAALLADTSGTNTGDQDLQSVVSAGNTTDLDIQFGDGVGVLLNNTSRLREGTLDSGAGGGVAQICAVGYELKWEAGSQYVMDGNGLLIREVNHKFTSIPDANNDDSQGFYVGSRWILDNGDLYICTDSTTAAAVWELQTIDAVPTDGSVKAVESNGVFDALADKVDKEAGSRLITSAESTLLGNTSGTNTGDQNLSGLVPYTGATTDLVMPLSTNIRLLNTLNVNAIAYVDNSNNLQTLSLVTYPNLTELSRVKGLTSAVQTQLDSKVPSTASTTGSVISFVTPQVYNTFSSPSTADLTDDLTNAKIGYIQKIYHNKVTAPTVPAGWVLIGTGTYTTSTLNIIFAEWVSSTRVEYWITKPA